MKNAARTLYKKLPASFRKQASKLYHRYRYPALLFRIHSAPRFQNTYFQFMKTVQSPIVMRRYRLREELLAQHNEFSIQSRQGFARYAPKNFPFLNDVLQEARESLKAHEIKQLVTQSKKPFLVKVPYDCTLDSPFIQFATHPRVLAPIAEYLGIVPVLTSVILYYSPNEMMESGRSQSYHLDETDKRVIKLWVFIEEVSEDTGPLTIIDAAVSQTIFKEMRRRGDTRSRNEKHDDSRIEMLTTQPPTPLTGPPGTIAFVDTDNCYHYGSRPGTRPRYMLMFQYHSPWAYDMPLFWRRSNEVPFSALVTPETPELARLVLGYQ
ncbi:MAG: hypothetical protein VYA53_02710 [Acidobacteriota bacterium]|nr:hypothetical protein [Acidobacteriota bacterium]